MIVIDASALVKLLLKEEGWEELISYLKGGVLSPDLISKETVNAVWRRLRRGEISPEEARVMLKALKEIAGKVVKIVDENEYLEEAIGIAFTQNITIYDSLYIALAKREKLRLITADQAQAEAAKAERLETTLIK